MAKPIKTGDWSVAYACLALKCSLWLAGALLSTPFQRILEATVCRIHYREADSSVINPQDDVSEELCKVASIQKVVTDINGLVSALDILPAVLAALLYLAILSRFNRRSLLLLNTSGLILMQLYYAAVLYFYNVLSVRWIYLTGFFALIGGGFPVFNSLLPALIAESIPQDSLSTFQLYSSAISLVVQIAGRSASLIMMKTSMWLPVVLGLTIYLTAIVIILISFRDDSVHAATSSSRGMKQARAAYAYRLLGSDADEDIELDDVAPESDAESNHVGISVTLLGDLGRQYRPVFVHSLLPIVIISMRDFGIMYRSILPYWMSRRYHWEIREVGWVHLGETLFTALIVAMLPSFAKGIFRTATKPSTSATARVPNPLDIGHGDQSPNAPGPDRPPTAVRLADYDLGLAKLCVLLSALGTILLGFSWYRFSAIISIVVLAGGTGFQDAYFSFLAGQMVNKDNNLTKLYMILSMMALFSADCGGWAISSIYSLALKIDAESWWTSAPMWFSSGAFIVSWAMLRRHR